MNSNKLLKPSNTYLKLIYQGYKDFNLNPWLFKKYLIFIYKFIV